MTTVENFFTLEQSETGVKVPLKLPDGTPTEHFIVLRGTDSDAFRNGSVEINQRFLKTAGKELSTVELVKQREEKNLLFLSLLVVSWTFPDPCDEKNKIRILRNAPVIAEQVDRFANDRTNFFKKPSPNS